MIKILHHLNKLQIKSKIRVSKYLLFIILSALFFYPISTIYAALSCSVTTAAACTGGSVVLLRMSGSTNAHAELPSQSNANYASNVVCCSSASSIGNSCSGNFQTFGRLSAVTNAHMQETSVNTYGSSACLSDTSAGDTITYGYQNTNCSGYDTTLFSMSASDNATVGDGSAYTKKVCATIFTPSITFDLDTYNTSTTSTEVAAPYSVALGTLSTASVTGTTEGGSTTPNGIWFDLDTNATGGAVVTVTSTNAALKSTSTPGDTIPSASAAMAAGTANYGICANRNAVTGSGTLTKVAPFASTCGTTPSSNTVGAVTTSAQTIYNTSSAPISGGRGEIMVDAAISTATVAHADYTDTLTLLATSTF